MGKPVHPAAVHFPIAFLFLAYSMDILNHTRAYLPSTVSSSLATSNDMTRASYYLLSLGLITVVPALITGVQQLIVMVSKQGMYEADGKTIRPKIKATLAHAVFNDVMIAISTWIWYTRRSAANETLKGKIPGTAENAYAPTGNMVIAGAVATGIMVYAASIGGVLTYNYGVGLQSVGGKNKEVNLRAGKYSDDIVQKNVVEPAKVVGEQYAGMNTGASLGAENTLRSR